MLNFQIQEIEELNLKKDEDIATVMTNEDIEACFDVNKMLRHVDTIFARFGL